MKTTINILYKRAQFFREIREYFHKESIVEVDTPVMSQFGNTDPALVNFITTFNGPGTLYKENLYLITSPEYHMKRLLAQGLGSCYYLGKVFRDGELSKRHNPEFTILEWYRLNYRLDQLIEEVIEIIKLLSERPLSVQYFTYRDAFRDILNIDPFQFNLLQLIEVIKQEGIDLAFELQTKDDALDLLVSHRIEPAFDPEKITILHDYPASQASLSKIEEKDGNLVGKRFELYWKGLELANGYEELTNSKEQRARFVAENKIREKNGLKKVPIDELLLAKLDSVPSCSGVAIGVDRVFMAINDIRSIASSMPFGIEEA